MYKPIFDTRFHDGIDVITDSRFWDCECGGRDFIHLKAASPRCERCGFGTRELDGCPPDSRVVEIAEQGLYACPKCKAKTFTTPGDTGDFINIWCVSCEWFSEINTPGWKRSASAEV